MGKLDDKVAIVTGGAGGIGRATVALFKREGAQVVASDLQAVEAPEGADQLIVHDVTREDDWQRLISGVRARYGPIDVLVNNAGIVLTRSVEETSLEDWRRVMAVNLDGVFLGLKHGIASMKARGGTIVNLSSVAALVAAPQLAAYSASKGAVCALSRSAAIHCTGQSYPIRINAVLPGFADTAMLDEITGRLGGEARVKEKLAQRQPIGRLASAEEIAKAVLYLASDDSSYVTGSELVVDGGFSAR